MSIGYIKKALLFNKKAISPVIATILVIAITVIITIPIYVYMSSKPEAFPPVSIVVNIDYDEDNQLVNITHQGGDTIFNALSTDPVNEFNILTLIVNSDIPNIASIDGNKDFAPGDTIVVELVDPLQSNDRVKLVYGPRNQLLESTKLL